MVKPTFIYEGPFPMGIDSSFEERHDITFVGGFAHPPNFDGIKWFIDEVFPKVLAAMGNVRLNVIGSNPPDELLALGSERINVTGFVSDQVLEEYYAHTRIVVAPLRFGAGVKGKIIEAIAYGIPIVTTSTGIEGIPNREAVAIVADSADEMARTICAIYPDRERWQAIRVGLAQYARDNVSVDHAKDVITRILN